MNAAVRALLRLEARRLGEPFRHARVGVSVALLLSAVLVIGALWVAADALRPDAASGDGAVLLGLLVSSPVAFWAYPILFRPPDDRFLRAIGLPAAALYQVRGARLLALALGAALVVLVPFAAAGQPWRGPLVSATAAAVAAWGGALFATSSAARALALPRPTGEPRRGGGYDPELAAMGPLLFAPLLPVLLGALAARLAASPAVAPLAAWAGAVAVGALLGHAGKGRFAAALPRFAPRAAEMAFVPAPAADPTGFAASRGLAALLPRRAALVRTRDVLVVDRRFRWAVRLMWPAAGAGGVALLRAGTDPAVRTWVVAAAGLVLAIQAAAIVGVGRIERRGPGWVDRALGIRTADRIAGRSAAGFGLALWLVVPLAAAWAVGGAGAGTALWFVAPALLFAAAATASVLVASR